MRTYEVPVEISSNTYDVATFKTCEEAHLFAKLIQSEVWECVKEGKDVYSIYKIEDEWIPRRIAIELLNERMEQLEKSQRTQEIITWVTETARICNETQVQ